MCTMSFGRQEEQYTGFFPACSLYAAYLPNSLHFFVRHKGQFPAESRNCTGLGTPATDSKTSERTGRRQALISFDDFFPRLGSDGGKVNAVFFWCEQTSLPVFCSESFQEEVLVHLMLTEAKRRKGLGKEGSRC